MGNAAAATKQSGEKKPCQKGREPLFFQLFRAAERSAHAAFEVILMMASRIDNLSPLAYTQMHYCFYFFLHQW
jgi:hypothetical protein